MTRHPKYVVMVSFQAILLLKMFLLTSPIKCVVFRSIKSNFKFWWPSLLLCVLNVRDRDKEYAQLKQKRCTFLYILVWKFFFWPIHAICDLWPTYNVESLPSRGILRNQRHLAKVLNSEFYLCPRSKPHLQNRLTDSQEIFTKIAQGTRHNKWKIKS